MADQPYLKAFSAPWSIIESDLAAVAEAADQRPNSASIRRLEELGLVEIGTDPPRLSNVGDDYFRARFVHQDRGEIREVLATLLYRQPIVMAACAALWGRDATPVGGALRLLRQLTKVADDEQNRRWLAVMNAAGLVVYNPAHPTIRVLFNPAELTSAEEADRTEREGGRVLSPDTPFSNLMALRSVIRAARSWLWWYEAHMPAKVLEILVREIDGNKVAEVRVLSGPTNVDADLQAEFARFAREMKTTKGIDAQWRVLTREEARVRHDRLILSDGMAKNLPPLNTILMGSVGEILPSEISPQEFETWWDLGTDLAAFSLPAS